MCWRCWPACLRRPASEPGQGRRARSWPMHVHACDLRRQAMSRNFQEVRRLALRGSLLAAVGLAALGAQPALAQKDYPAKPVRLVVGFAAGGPTHAVARALSAPPGKALGPPLLGGNNTPAHTLAA